MGWEGRYVITGTGAVTRAFRIEREDRGHHGLAVSRTENLTEGEIEAAELRLLGRLILAPARQLVTGKTILRVPDRVRDRALLRGEQQPGEQQLEEGALRHDREKTRRKKGEATGCSLPRR